MKKDLELFLKKYIPLADTSDFINAFQITKVLKKKDFLLQPDQNSNFLAFITKGTFRVFFYDNDAVDITVWFSFKGMMVGDLLAFYQGTKARFYIEAVEDSEILIIPKNSLEELYLKRPDYRQFGRKYAEFVAINVMERMLSLQTKTAKERYRELLARPEYMKKIPLKYLASYIGITDSSLSRIRKNLS